MIAAVSGVNYLVSRLVYFARFRSGGNCCPAIPFRPANFIISLLNRYETIITNNKICFGSVQSKLKIFYTNRFLMKYTIT